MSREIKFRAWDKVNKKYIKRVLAGCNVRDESYVCNLVYDETSKDWVHFDEGCGTLEQYTGLKDKNGVEIYEGDILSADGYWGVVIEFENGSFMCKASDKVQYANNTINIPISRFGVLRLYEVIGNIHESEE